MYTVRVRLGKKKYKASIVQKLLLLTSNSNLYNIGIDSVTYTFSAIDEARMFANGVSTLGFTYVLQFIHIIGV